MAHNYNHNGLEDALDVWLRFDSSADDEATYEANTYPNDDGTGYVVKWYHNFVGQVSEREFGSYWEAQNWLAENGYEDYTAFDD